MRGFSRRARPRELGVDRTRVQGAARRMTTPAFSSREGHGPLSGVTVLDLSGYVAGPYGCTLPGDQGAGVLKIDPPEGANLRNYPSTPPGESRAFPGANPTKPSIRPDFKRPASGVVRGRMAA